MPLLALTFEGFCFPIKMFCTARTGSPLAPLVRNVSLCVVVTREFLYIWNLFAQAKENRPLFILNCNESQVRAQVRAQAQVPAQVPGLVPAQVPAHVAEHARPLIYLYIHITIFISGIFHFGYMIVHITIYLYIWIHSFLIRLSLSERELNGQVTFGAHA